MWKVTWPTFSRAFLLTYRARANDALVSNYARSILRWAAVKVGFQGALSPSIKHWFRTECNPRNSQFSFWQTVFFQQRLDLKRSEMGLKKPEVKIFLQAMMCHARHATTTTVSTVFSKRYMDLESQFLQLACAALGAWKQQVTGPPQAKSFS